MEFLLSKLEGLDATEVEPLPTSKVPNEELSSVIYIL